MVLDLVLVTLAMTLAATTVHDEAGLVIVGSRVLTPPLVVLTVTAVFWLTLLRSGAYRVSAVGSGSEEFTAVLMATGAFVAAAAVLEFVFDLGFSRRLAFGGALGAMVLVGVGHYLSRRPLHRRRAQGADSHRVLVLGPPALAAELATHLHRSAYIGFRVVGVAPTAPVDDEVGGALAVLPYGVDMRPAGEDVLAAAAAVGADVIAVAGDGRGDAGGLRRLSWALEGTGIGLLVAPAVLDVAGPRLRVRPVAGLPLLELTEPRLTSSVRFLREIVNRLTALVFGLVAAPLWIGAAVVVAVTSRGPVLFRQTRVGEAGREFTMLKFRSMVVDAEDCRAGLVDANEADGPLFKVRDDPRITPVGRCLRRWWIDELPQLWNVMRGDMAIVGPRPPLPEEVAAYDRDTLRRLQVKPGLTGLWQVSGRADLPWDEAVRLDLYYVEQWSPTLDSLILWKTAFAVQSRRGAY